MLVTNYREFVLVDQDANGNPARLERFQLAADAEDFDRQLEKPRAFAGRVGVGLGEHLRRVLSRTGRGWRNRGTWRSCWPRTRGTPLLEWGPPKPSPASGGLAAGGGTSDALEEALGVQFKGEQGARFFRSTLVQTLFYGVFSAWVLGARQRRPPIGSVQLA